MRKNYLLIASVLVAIACEKELDVDIVNENPKLVVNALFNPDSTWVIDLSKNAHILDPYPSFPPVTDAHVTIVNQNNDIVEALSFVSAKNPQYGNIERGVYRGKTKPVAGQVYTIMAEANNVTQIQATNIVPLLVPVKLLELDSSQYQSDDKRIELKIGFTDHGDEKNYYQIKILMKIKTASWFPSSTGTRDTVRSVVEYEIPFGSVNEAQEINSQTVFTDTYFNGKEKTVHLEFRTPTTYTSLYARQEFYDFRVVLRNASEAYYKYFTSINLYSDTSDNPLAQPVQIFNNVENGFGIFAGYSASMIRLE